MIVLYKEEVIPGFSLDSVVVFDAVTYEVHTQESRITEHPVEKGTPVSDNVSPASAKISLRAVISNTPINPETLYTGFATSIGGYRMANLPFLAKVPITRWLSGAYLRGGYFAPFQINGFTRMYSEPFFQKSSRTTLPGVAGGTLLKAPVAFDRIDAVWSALRVVCSTGKLCTLFTDLRTYDDVILTKISAPQEGSSSMEFALEFTQTRYADVAENQSAKLSTVVLEPRAAPPSSSTPPETFATVAEEDQTKSIALSLLGS